MPDCQRKIIVVAAVFVAGLLAGIALIIFLEARPQPEPDTSRLKDLLHSTAQKEIALPPLADAEVELTIDRAKLDEEIERIKSLAAKFGGTAIQASADDTGTDIIAEISPKYTDQFLEALKHPEMRPVSDLKAEDKQAALVEVRLKFQS